MQSVITGTGSHLPDLVVPNEEFIRNEFYDSAGNAIAKSKEEIVKKVEDISGIRERRYVSPEQNATTISAHAAQKAIDFAGIDKEQIDGLIAAHNIGNITHDHHMPVLIPNLAAQIKKELGIQNHRCVASDLLFGCPGWIEGLIQAHRMIQCGEAKHVLVVGVEVLSRIIDPHDMNSMLFGDGAGAVVLSAEERDPSIGILCHNTYSHCGEEVDYLYMGKSYHPDENQRLYIKMQGKQVFKYAMSQMPTLISECLGKVDIKLSDVSKIFLHQANEKMIKAITEKLFAEHGLSSVPETILPITIQSIGNSSVATIPTLLDMVWNDELPGHKVKAGDIWVFASVGAGMHTNCLIYKVPEINSNRN